MAIGSRREAGWRDSGAYVVYICPECKCQQPGVGGHAAHHFDCPNYGKTFALEALKVLPLDSLRGGSDCVERLRRYRTALEAIVDHGDGAPDDYAHEIASAALRGPEGLVA